MWIEPTCTCISYCHICCTCTHMYSTRILLLSLLRLKTHLQSVISALLLAANSRSAVLWGDVTRYFRARFSRLILPTVCAVYYNIIIMYIPVCYKWNNAVICLVLSRLRRKHLTGLLFLLDECTLVSAFAVHFLMKNLLPAGGRVICGIHIFDVTCSNIEKLLVTSDMYDESNIHTSIMPNDSRNPVSQHAKNALCNKI